MARFLSGYDRDQTLLELIAHLDTLVKKNKVAAAGAFYIIAETAKEHPDFPEEKPKPVIAIPPPASIEVEWPSTPSPIPPPEPMAVLPLVEAAPVAEEPVSDDGIPF